MSEEKSSGLDPRFDPAFQRGFDHSKPIEHYVPDAPPRKRPEVSLPIAPAATTHAEPPTAAPAAPVSLDAPESPGRLTAVEEVSPTRNPFLLALLIIGVVLIVGGVVLFVQTGNEFNSSEVQSQGDYMSLNATIEMAPFVSLLGGATLIGVLFVFAVGYRRKP